MPALSPKGNFQVHDLHGKSSPNEEVSMAVSGEQSPEVARPSLAERVTCVGAVDSVT